MSEQFAVLSDVHGNRWALEAVLQDIAKERVAGILHLGDAVWGVLDPAGTIDLLQSAGIRSIAGNQDREVLDPALPSNSSPSLQFTRTHLTPAHLAWLAALKPTEIVGDFLLCHGTPASDTTYLLEHVTGPDCVEPRPLAAVRQLLGPACKSTVILCGHTHLAHVRTLDDGRLIVNPGSVGLPAYSDDQPYPHAMESGSPHARYALLTRGESGWRSSLREVIYDWEEAARVAEQHGRPEWAYQLRHGRVERKTT